MIPAIDDSFFNKPPHSQSKNNWSPQVLHYKIFDFIYLYQPTNPTNKLGYLCSDYHPPPTTTNLFTMQLSFSAIAILLAFAVNHATADSHQNLVCVRTYPDNNSAENLEATRCACDWLKKNGKCDDCTIWENRLCHSDAKSLDGNEFEDACVRKCPNLGATGSSIPPA